MSDDVKVWVRTRKLDSGVVRFDLRWIDPDAHKWRSRKVRWDEKRTVDENRREAERQAGVQVDKLRRGAADEPKKATWEEFVAAYTPTIPGEAHRRIAGQTLKEFGDLAAVLSPRRATHAALKTYAVKLREKGNSPATINKKLRYLRLAFNEALEDGYIVKHPMGRRWKWEPEEEPLPREVTPTEEAALLTAAEAGDGWRFKTFIEVALGTGGRAGEVLGLAWARVTLAPVDSAEVLFVKTKGKKPRRVPINPELVDTFTKLKLQTQAIGGPYADWGYDEVQRMFNRATAAAGCPDVTIHDLRRTYITRLIRRVKDITAVKTLAGHAAIATTLKYYNAVHSDPDLRAAVATLRKGSAG